MTEEELEEIITAKGKFEIQERATKQWEDFIYSKEHIYQDGYYEVTLGDNVGIRKQEFTIHLPTLVNAMEKYSQELHKEYKELLENVKVEERN